MHMYVTCVFYSVNQGVLGRTGGSLPSHFFPGSWYIINAPDTLVQF